MAHNIYQSILNKTACALLAAVLLLFSAPFGQTAQADTPPLPEPVKLAEPPQPSIPPQLFAPRSAAPGLPAPLAPGLISSFEGLNVTDSGYIPPDPIAAAGPAYVLSVINVNIQWRGKDGSGAVSQTLAAFFTSLTPANATFDPKVIYDQHAGRFVVITLERVNANPNANPSPNNTSRILVAVSNTSDPNAGWTFQAINAKINAGGLDYWADYPGLAVDEEAIYITNNMFAFPPSTGFLRADLWILNKFNPAGGLYGGGSSSFTRHTPSTDSGSGFNLFTLQPAHIFGTAPVGVGTWLMQYGGLVFGGVSEALALFRINNPLTAPTFTAQFINLGDFDQTYATALPDAPQPDIATLIEVNDRRALHAVWRSDSLYLVNTVLPNSGTDLNQTTAHWLRVNTTNLAAPSLSDQGHIGGEDIQTGAYTYFPALAVDPCGNMAVVFSASGSSTYAGAYYTLRYASDPAGTVQPTSLLVAGQASYALIDGSGRNRWGDYGGASLDPANQATFWGFHQYARTPVTFSSEWSTRYGSFPSGIDFGDLPAAYALTTFAEDGVRHCQSGVYLGGTPDPDGDGQPSPNASADGADEDGVALAGLPWQNGANGASLSITVGGSGSACLNAWIDWNADNNFTGTDEHIINNAAVTGGTAPSFSFTVPAGTFGGPERVFYSRFRLFPSCPASPATAYTGLALGGEVEDYTWSFAPNAVNLRQVTAGSAITDGSWQRPALLLVILLGLQALILLPRLKKR